MPESAHGARGASRWRDWRRDARAIFTLAWPVLVGQLAVLGFSTVDTVLTARAGAQDLAALAVGGAAYITIFIGLMGAVLALGPIVGQLRGAGRLAEAGYQLHQSVWLALGLCVPGCALLLWPEVFLAMSQVEGAVAAKVRGYLGVLALALPAALLFTAYRGFNTAVARPKAVMVLQLGGLALKVPVSAALVFGVGSAEAPMHLPALGVLGCAVATTLVMWAQTLAAWWMLRRDPFYAPYDVPRRQLHAPHRASLWAQLRLGLPMAASLLIEVSGFSFMAVFIARLGTTPVAGHQIAANLVAMLFMVPLALGSASSTLVAQAVGAGRHVLARRVGWHGLELGLVVAAAMALVLWFARPAVLAAYTSHPAVVAAALPLLGWVAIMHVADAAQTIAAFVLRAWRIATLPMLIYAVALWGVGLAGGHALAFGIAGLEPLGARGFWIASTAGLFVAAIALGALLLVTLQRGRWADSA